MEILSVNLSGSGHTCCIDMWDYVSDGFDVSKIINKSSEDSVSDLSPKPGSDVSWTSTKTDQTLAY